MVDNDDGMLVTLDKLWREAGCEVVTTWSGREALGFLRSHRFDVLLVDDYVVDMHIGEFLKRVSQLPSSPRIFVMQPSPIQNHIRFEGATGQWPIVDKTQIADVITGVARHGQVVSFFSPSGS